MICSDLVICSEGHGHWRKGTVGRCDHCLVAAPVADVESDWASVTMNSRYDDDHEKYHACSHECLLVVVDTHANFEMYHVTIQFPLDWDLTSRNQRAVAINQKRET